MSKFIGVVYANELTDGRRIVFFVRPDGATRRFECTQSSWSRLHHVCTYLGLPSLSGSAAGVRFVRYWVRRASRSRRAMVGPTWPDWASVPVPAV